MDINKLINLDASDLNKIFADAGLPVDDTSSALYTKVLQPLVGTILDTRLKPLAELAKQLKVLSDLSLVNNGTINLDSLTDEQKQAFISIGRLKGMFKYTALPATFTGKAYLKDDYTILGEQIDLTYTVNSTTKFTGKVLIDDNVVVYDGTQRYVWLYMQANGMCDTLQEGDTILVDSNAVDHIDILHYYSGSNGESDNDFLLRVLTTTGNINARDALQNQAKKLFPDLSIVTISYGDPRLYRLPAIPSESAPADFNAAIDFVVAYNSAVLEKRTVTIEPINISKYLAKTGSATTTLVDWGGATLRFARNSYRCIMENGKITMDSDGILQVEVGVDPTLPSMKNYIYSYVDFTSKNGVLDAVQEAIDDVQQAIENTGTNNTTTLLDGTVIKNKNVLEYLEGMLPGMPLAYKLTDFAMQNGYVYKLELSQFTGSFVGIESVTINDADAVYGTDYIILADKTQVFRITKDSTPKTSLFFVFSNKVANKEIKVTFYTRHDNNILVDRIESSGFTDKSSNISIMSPIPIFTISASNAAQIMYPSGKLEQVNNSTTTPQMLQHPYAKIPGVYQIVPGV